MPPLPAGPDSAAASRTAEQPDGVLVHWRPGWPTRHPAAWSRTTLPVRTASGRPSAARSVTGMDYTHLGRSGVSVSRLCLGTMNFGAVTGEAEANQIMDSAHEH